MEPVVLNISRRSIISAFLATNLLPKIANAREDAVLMKMRITFDRQDFTASLFNNPSSRELAGMLPLDLTIADFSTNEKIAYLPRKLTQLARGPVPDAGPGGLCYYVPWGNLAFFHGSYESTRELVRLGRLDGGVEPLLTRGEFPLRITAA